ncbi:MULTISPECIES: DUF6048 family protein [unclassified Tenacibaculum]|uniref:DUF6048 family protein n=1 Tax=unclassified Tenacibaculum TaxID=2635139 RepID=UPI001F305CC6|nr:MULTISPECIES: DUF6048 family protein [unclassified Tenacibaculum]MCF2874984.1 DUF6048 family protein [Tenacibaculum sp. Cn5-1]MCF2935060.1 DUF6048 family protein [Tenacibaculum sp. Cn5-34]MCG7511498.1 DUF6048 family protein [Tenacibaculum sp. Cn5-46]
MYKYIISLCLTISFLQGYAQKAKNSETPKDTIVYKTGYGLRLGVDISKPGLSIFDKSYSGLEIVGDYRVSKKWYVATELGYEKETTFEDFTNSTSKGSYIRLGANYNAYQNWLDMNNEIYVGMRYGFALFDQTLNSYRPNVGNSYFPSNTITTPVTDTGLTAHWTEFQLGIKVETLKNLFVSASFSYKIMISVDDQTNFKTLYAPGFNRVFESSTGFGFNYTISYLIPFVNK